MSQQSFSFANDEPVDTIPPERDYLIVFSDGSQINAHGYLMVNSTMTMVGTGPLSQGRITASIPNGSLKYVTEVAPISQLNG